MSNRILFLNLGNFGSTGKIVNGIASLAEEKGIAVSKCYPVNRNNNPKELEDILLGSRRSCRISRGLSYYTGLDGVFHVLATGVFLRKIEKLHPAIIHLHNLHWGYISLPVLFRYLKKKNIPVVWTLHDCWSFTGHCPHFTYDKCDKWRTGCYGCKRYQEYPRSCFDNSRFMWKLKKRWFTGVENMTLVTPSQWLADLVKQSYLKDYPVKVINNGIDLSVFKPTDSEFRQKCNIPAEKFVLLGVSFAWGKRKGLDVFIELAKRLNPEQYQIVLVGTDDTTERILPDNICSIHRTQNQQELAEIYTAADLFVNPTREENFPTVNMESLACGVPVLTFRTGGSPEILDETCGSVVPCDDIDAMEREIIRICVTKPFTKEACLKRAKAFEMNDSFQGYIELYNEIIAK